MRNPFKKWFGNARRTRKSLELEPQPDPPMPTLPPRRARRLTATPCLPAATANSDLFQRIPPEIRRQILIEAFGELPMHFDLRLLHPAKKNCAPKPRHDGRLPHANFPDVSERDSSAPREWEWCGSVCHNLWPRARPTSSHNYLFEEGDNNCWTGYASNCHSWPGDIPAKCCIGAMGWLLTCRLAYIEGIEVLYATNRIRIHGKYLLSRLPDLLLPQRRAAIRSVQLHWNIHPWRDSPSPDDRHEYQPGSDMNGFRLLLKALPVILPNLTFLYLDLRGDFSVPGLLELGLSRTDEVVLDSSDDLLQLVDQMMINLHRLSDFLIFLPSSFFRARKFKEKGIGYGFEGRLNMDEPLWRDIAAQTKLQQDERAAPATRGYWICAGEHDRFHPHDYIPGPVCF